MCKCAVGFHAHGCYEAVLVDFIQNQVCVGKCFFEFAKGCVADLGNVARQVFAFVDTGCLTGKSLFDIQRGWQWLIAHYATAALAWASVSAALRQLPHPQNARGRGPAGNGRHTPARSSGKSAPRRGIRRPPPERRRLRAAAHLPPVSARAARPQHRCGIAVQLEVVRVDGRPADFSRPSTSGRGRPMRLLTIDISDFPQRNGLQPPTASYPEQRHTLPWSATRT